MLSEKELLSLGRLREREILTKRREAFANKLIEQAKAAKLTIADMKSVLAIVEQAMSESVNNTRL